MAIFNRGVLIPTFLNQQSLSVQRTVIYLSEIISLVIFTSTIALADVETYEIELGHYARQTKVISGGRFGGSKVSIRIGGHDFYEQVPDSMGTIGLYVVAIYKNEVLLNYHYNTYFDDGASEGFARDVGKLPSGTFVVVAAREDPTRLFDRRGQQALYDIGAKKGILDQPFRTSYLCIGVKGLSRGKAIEKVGMEQLSYMGPECDDLIQYTFPENPEPKVIVKPGNIQRMIIGDAEVLYYIPKYFDPETAEYFFGIHGAGGSGGAWTIIDEFRVISDIKNYVLIAPRFDGIYNASFTEMERKEKSGKTFDFPLLKDFYLTQYQFLLNNRNPHRSDLKLIEIFNVFNKELMRRERFLRAHMCQSADLLGCTEMAIHVRLRIKPNPRRQPHARVIQTCENQWGGSVIGIHETNRICAWIHTTSSKSTVVVHRRIGVSPKVYSKVEVDDGQWHDVVLTYTGSEVLLFVDGVLQDKTQWDGAIVNSDFINIGYVASNGFYFDGEIDDIEILGHKTVQ